jgi:hypothetical protein
MVPMDPHFRTFAWSNYKIPTVSRYRPSGVIECPVKYFVSVTEPYAKALVGSFAPLISLYSGDPPFEREQQLKRRQGPEKSYTT